MKKMTKKSLAKWCSNYSNCYYYLYNGDLNNTGDCPFACDTLSSDVLQSKVFEEVTDYAEKYHPQLEYEVEHNDCRLFRIIDDFNVEVIICYFSHNFG